MGEGISWKGVFVVWTAVCEEQVSSTIVKERGEDGGEIHEKSVTRMIDERSSPLLSFFAIVKNSVTWVTYRVLRPEMMQLSRLGGPK